MSVEHVPAGAIKVDRYGVIHAILVATSERKKGHIDWHGGAAILCEVLSLLEVYMDQEEYIRLVSFVRSLTADQLQ